MAAAAWDALTSSGLAGHDAVDGDGVRWAVVLGMVALGVADCLLVGQPGTATSVYVAVVAGTFIFFYPVLAGQPLTIPDWAWRIWFPSWN